MKHEPQLRMWHTRLPTVCDLRSQYFSCIQMPHTYITDIEPMASLASTRVQSWGTKRRSGRGVRGVFPSPPGRSLGRGKCFVCDLEMACFGKFWGDIHKYVIMGDIPIDVPLTKALGDVSPASPAGLTPVIRLLRSIGCCPC